MSDKNSFFPVEPDDVVDKELLELLYGPDSSKEPDSFLSELKSEETTESAGKTIPSLRTPSKDQNTGKEKNSSAETPGPYNTHSSVDPIIRRKMIIIVLCAVLLLFSITSVGVYSLIRSADPYQNRILKNVYIAGVNVGGMKIKEAEKALSDAFSSETQVHDIVVTFTDTQIELDYETTKATIDYTAAVKAAYELGREKNSQEQFASFEASENGGIQLSGANFVTLNEDAIRSKLQELIGYSAGSYVPSSYYVEGDAPALDEESFNPDAPAQILTLNLGSPGSGLDIDQVVNDIRDAYARHEYQLNLDYAAGDNTPNPLDLQAIYDEINVAPEEPSIDRATLQRTPGAYGVTFDFDKVQELLEKANYGESIHYPLEYVAPKLSGDEIYFQDVLGFCATPHGNNEKRNTNLQIACAALDGVIIQPGETLSYSKTIKPRTEENGYQPAPAYSGTNLVDSVGGGVCQVSSTLYLCSLYAEMEIVERVNHGYPANYMPAGLDATVSGESPDMIIKNPYNLPVKILAEEDGTYVKVWILGLDMRDHYVKMQFSAGGNYAKTTKNTYNRETNALVSSELDRMSGYFSNTLSAFGEIGPHQVYINGNVKDLDSTVYAVPER